jgi:uncharacterized cupin superfamily protein
MIRGKRATKKGSRYDRFHILSGATSLGLALAGSGLFSASFGQTSGQATTPANRTILQEADVAVHLSSRRFSERWKYRPARKIPFIYGTEMGYVVAGHIRLEVKGQPPKDLGPGDSFLVPVEPFIVQC